MISNKSSKLFLAKSFPHIFLSSLSFLFILSLFFFLEKAKPWAHANSFPGPTNLLLSPFSPAHFLQAYSLSAQACQLHPHPLPPVRQRIRTLTCRCPTNGTAGSTPPELQVPPLQPLALLLDPVRLDVAPLFLSLLFPANS